MSEDPKATARRRALDALERLDHTARALREHIEGGHPAINVCQSLITAAGDAAMRTAQLEALTHE